VPSIVSHMSSVLALPRAQDDCSDDSPYTRYLGALQCILDDEDGGDIAFVKQSTVADYMASNPDADSDLKVGRALGSMLYSVLQRLTCWTQRQALSACAFHEFLHITEV